MRRCLKSGQFLCLVMRQGWVLLRSALMVIWESLYLQGELFSQRWGHFWVCVIKDQPVVNKRYTSSSQKAHSSAQVRLENYRQNFMGSVSDFVAIHNVFSLLPPFFIVCGNSIIQLKVKTIGKVCKVGKLSVKISRQRGMAEEIESRSEMPY